MIEHTTMTLYSAAITLLLVMDPLGNIPIFITILNSVDESKRSRVILRESLIAYVALVLFLFAGNAIMRGLNITTPALEIAGGIILFLIAIKMIFPGLEGDQRERQIGEPFVVPLAIPLLAGPSAFATVLLFATQAPEKMAVWFIAIAIASAISTVILLFSAKLRRLFGAKGLVALERLMGMILTTISVQMFLSGLTVYLATVPRV